MPRTLDQPALLEPPAADGAIAQPPSAENPPSLPEHFDEEARTAFLYDFLNPDLTHFRVAENAGLRLSQYHAYVNSPEFQERLAQQSAVSEMRAKACAKLAQAEAIAALRHIIATYNELERNAPVPRDMAALSLRQRHRESARRAATLILRATGVLHPLTPRVPPLAAADQPSTTHPDHTSPRRSGAATQPEPAFHLPVTLPFHASEARARAMRVRDPDPRPAFQDFKSALARRQAGQPHNQSTRQQSTSKIENRVPNPSPSIAQLTRASGRPTAPTTPPDDTS